MTKSQRLVNLPLVNQGWKNVKSSIFDSKFSLIMDIFYKGNVPKRICTDKFLESLVGTFENNCFRIGLEDLQKNPNPIRPMWSDCADPCLESIKNMIETSSFQNTIKSNASIFTCSITCAFNSSIDVVFESVVSTIVWATTLKPIPRGSFNFLCQSYIIVRR